ncbi:MAG: hypothetical protein Q6353_005990 [Candidatus Sigynarchaeum springense]
MLKKEACNMRCNMQSLRIPIIFIVIPTCALIATLVSLKGATPAMAGVAVIALFAGVLAGRRGAARPAKRAARDDIPAPATSAKVP